MSVYYNEFDPYAAQWLRNLIAAGHLPAGDVDDRDIREVSFNDLQGYKQCHFFAGIGGWALAVRMAGLEDVEGLWTGSPPCQPFSVAGKGKGVKDERHLAPVWLDLIRGSRPKHIFGEQVAAATSKDEWLDTLQNALEAEGYATGQVVLPACSVGAPHLRQRLWFTAQRLGNAEHNGQPAEPELGGAQEERRMCESERPGSVSGMDYAEGMRQQGRPLTRRCGERSESQGVDGRERRDCSRHNMANTGNPRLEGHRRPEQVDGSERRPESYGHSSARGINSAGDTANAGWGDCDWLYCRDERWRSVESGTFPLADGVSGRVGRLRAYGNAIVPQVAAEVLEVVLL